MTGELIDHKVRALPSLPRISGTLNRKISRAAVRPHPRQARLFFLGQLSIFAVAQDVPAQSPLQMATESPSCADKFIVASAVRTPEAEYALTGLNRKFQ